MRRFGDRLSRVSKRMAGHRHITSNIYLNPGAIIKRKNDFIIQNVGGESLLVPIGARVVDVNGVVVLNDTARCVWELLAQERSVDELAAAVTKRFDVDFEHARVDVQTFLDEIAQMDMLQQ